MLRPPGMLRWLATAFCAIACGGCAVSTPRANASPAPDEAGATYPKAPLDLEVAGLPGARASYVDAPVFGGRLYVLQLGPAEPLAAPRPPLVLVHGLGSAGVRDFYPILPGLARGRRVIAFDLPGFARSSGAKPPYVPLRYAEVVAAVIRTYAGGRADVLGHSMGAAIALEHSARHPEQVHRLVLIDAAGILHRSVFMGHRMSTSMHAQLAPLRDGAGVVSPQASERAQRLTEDIAQNVAGGGRALLSMTSPLRPSRETLASLAPQGAPTQAALALIEHNFGAAVSESRAPTLVLWGHQDPIAPLRTAYLLENRLRGSKLVVLDDVEHDPMSQAPQQTLEAVLAHLDRASEPRTRDALTPSPSASEKLESAHCKNEAGFELSGAFDEVILEHCRRARLRGVTARRLIVRHSSVSGVSVRVLEGVHAEESEVILTGGSLRGPTAIDAASSVFDLAGVEIESEDPTHVQRRSTFLLSACTLRKRSGVRHLHGEFVLKRGRSF